MIIVRDVFQLKFGKAKDARASLKVGLAMLVQAGVGGKSPRLLTDFTGPAYRLILEGSYDSLADYERQLAAAFALPGWGESYQKFVPFVESSHREILIVVEG